MKVLVVGSGGREHAIVDKVLQSPLVDKLYVAPGNYGIGLDAELVNIGVQEVNKLIEFCLTKKIELVIIGPEAALINGLSDELKKYDIKVLGPSKNAAQIETSKEFAKKLMNKYDIPNAKYQSFSDFGDAHKYLNQQKTFPVVIKYDGLAAGKGVYIVNNEGEAKVILKSLLVDKMYGDENVIIEEFLDGDEFTLLALVNKDKVYPFQAARDFKRVYDNDKGLNTGGMGAICPYHNIDNNTYEQAVNILKDSAKALLEEGIEYCGVLYGGFIKTNNGVKVIEYNARFGDPETQCVLNNLDSDLVQNILDLLNESNVELKFKNQTSVGLVLSAKGYPEEHEKDVIINNYLNIPVKKYHMQTKMSNNNVQSNGGRVLFLLNSGSNSKEAYQEIYNYLEQMDNHTLHFRKDLYKY